MSAELLRRAAKQMRAEFGCGWYETTAAWLEAAASREDEHVAVVGQRDEDLYPPVPGDEMYGAALIARAYLGES
jgi:hypothetical protein